MTPSPESAEAPGAGVDPGPVVQDEPEAATAADTAPDAQPGTGDAPAGATPAREVVVERRGPGFLPLLLGGVLAAIIGYGLAFFGLLPVAGQDDPAATALPDRIAAQEATIAEQAATIASLESRLAGAEAEVAALADAPPPEMPEIPEVDLSGLEGGLAEVGEAVAANSTALEALAGRVTTLEERPIISPDAAAGATDEATAAAISQLEARLREQQARIDANAEEVRALSAEAQAQIAEAQAQLEAARSRLAESEADAQAEVEAAEAEAEAEARQAEAEAALAELEAALARGAPFAEELAAISTLDGVTIPEALEAQAEDGVPTRDELATQFPEIAREALPTAIQETAEDNAMGRVGAFLRGQVGGRSLTPREGDDPDAVLSRAEAAMREGDLTMAVEELQALPEGARGMFEDWMQAATARAGADAALETISAGLGDN